MYYTFRIVDIETDQEVMPNEIIQADTQEEAEEKLDASLIHRQVWFVRRELVSQGETNGNQNQPTL